MCFVARVLPWDFLLQRKSKKAKKTTFSMKLASISINVHIASKSRWIKQKKNIGIVENRLEAALGKVKYKDWTNPARQRDLYSLPEQLCSFLLRH